MKITDVEVIRLLGPQLSRPLTPAWTPGGSWDRRESTIVRVDTDEGITGWGAINAQDIGVASNMIGAGRATKDDPIDPAVGIILEVKIGEKVDAGSVLCRLYYTKEDNVDEAAEMVEDAFRVSGTKPDERELILEVVG